MRIGETLANLAIPQAVFIAAAVLSLGIIVILTVKYIQRLGRTRDELFEKLKGPALQEYYQCFPSMTTSEARNSESVESPVKSGETQTESHQRHSYEKFKRDFDRLYGWKKYLLPMPIVLLLIASGFLYVGKQLWPRLSGSGAAPSTGENLVILAILGGFIWVLADALERRYLNDLTPNAFYWMSFRMLAAVPLGYAFAKTFSESLGLVIAFFVSAFPASTIRRYGRRILQKAIKETEEKETGELSHIQGMSQTIIERLEEEGIRTVQQLAYADPIKLLIRSNFELAYILDWIDQAFICFYYGEGVAKLRPLGIRTALELVHLENYKHLFPRVAKELGLDDASADDNSVLKKTIDELKGDPYLNVIALMLRDPAGKAKTEALARGTTA